MRDRIDEQAFVLKKVNLCTNEHCCFHHIHSIEERFVHWKRYNKRFPFTLKMCMLCGDDAIKNRVHVYRHVTKELGMMCAAPKCNGYSKLYMTESGVIVTFTFSIFCFKHYYEQKVMGREFICDTVREIDEIVPTLLSPVKPPSNRAMRVHADQIIMLEEIEQKIRNFIDQNYRLR